HALELEGVLLELLTGSKMICEILQRHRTRRWSAARLFVLEHDPALDVDGWDYSQLDIVYVALADVDFHRSGHFGGTPTGAVRPNEPLAWIDAPDFKRTIRPNCGASSAVGQRYVDVLLDWRDACHASADANNGCAHQPDVDARGIRGCP